MNSRHFIALLATTGALPPAIASECIWPVAGPPAAAAPAAVPEGTPAKSPDELPVKVKSGSAEMTREGDAKLTGGVAISQGDREVTAESARE